MSSDALILDRVGFSYRDRRYVLKNVTFSVPCGKRVAIVGANGVGKTTLARLLCGLLHPTEGRITVDGVDTTDSTRTFDVKRRVGLVFQDPDDQIVETKVEREIAFGLRNLGLAPDEITFRVDSILKELGMEHLKGRACHLLSAGEKQLVTLASVIVMEPRYLVLDEPTSLLDRPSRVNLLRVIRKLALQRRLGIILVTMRIEDVWFAEEVIFLKQGTVGFRGGKIEFLDYLLAQRIYTEGDFGFILDLRKELGCVLERIRTRDDLTAELLADAITQEMIKGRGNTCQ